jgi:hypothetical protein
MLQTESMAKFVDCLLYNAILEKSSQFIVMIDCGMRQQSLKINSGYASSNDCFTETEVVIPKA